MLNQYEKDYNQGFNNALDIVDDIITEQIDKSNNPIECMALRWVLDKISELVRQD